MTDEAHAFINKIKSGALLGMSDEQLLKTFNQLDPQLISAYLELGVKPLNEYEIWTQRQERMGGNWANKPYVNYIKYRHKPRQVYMKWLKDSPKSGQEIIYDETKRKDAMYGHIGGLFNITSVWAALDGSLAKGNSNHTVRDLGMQSIVDRVASGNRARVKEGIPTAPNQIEVIKVNGDRTVAMTWITPAGMKGGYAYKSKIYVDLKQPWVRMTESWDEHGDIIERVSFDKIAPASFTDADFDPKNSSYAF
ncbi:MAG: DUF1571 domain-containing protein [Aquabacterium sp.]|nr:DUF1571 domain-containing protein [Aquabacterium sp.]